MDANFSVTPRGEVAIPITVVMHLSQRKCQSASAFRAMDTVVKIPLSHLVYPHRTLILLILLSDLGG